MHRLVYYCKLVVNFVEYYFYVCVSYLYKNPFNTREKKDSIPFKFGITPYKNKDKEFCFRSCVCNVIVILYLFLV